MTTNNFKPILFSTEMVQAILAGRKTQTRRVKGLDEINDNKDIFRYSGNDYFDSDARFYAKFESGLDCSQKPNEMYRFVKADIKKGDILWVRETFAEVPETAFGNKFIFKSTFDRTFSGPWKPSLFMPKEAARIFLKVTNVRCERLQDISEEDAISEGIDRFENSLFNETRYRDYTDGKRRDKDFNKYPEMAKQVGYSHYGGNPWPDWRDPITSFQSLWDSINAKKNPWKSNPWVWVYDFERIEKPENFI